MEVEKKSYPRQIIGTSGLYKDNEFVMEDLNRTLRMPQGAKIYKQMRDTDATIGSVTQLTLTLAETSQWTVKPGGVSPRDLELAEFVESCMNDMSHSWGDFITEGLSCHQFGFSFHEIIYKPRNGFNIKKTKSSKYKDGKIGWAKMPGRSQRSMDGWKWSGDGELEGMWQVDPQSGRRVLIPYDKALLFRTTTESSNPEGRSYYRSAYKSWKYKTKLEEIEGSSTERNLNGFPVMEIPQGFDMSENADPESKAMLSNIRESLSDIRRDTTDALMVPFGFKFSLMSSSSSNTDLSTMISRYDYNIASSMLSDIVRVGAGNSGSYALADVKRSILSKSVESLLKRISDEINTRAIPQLLIYNGMMDVETLPEIIFSPIETPSVKDIAFFLRSAGVSVGRAS